MRLPVILLMKLRVRRKSFLSFYLPSMVPFHFISNYFSYSSSDLSLSSSEDILHAGSRDDSWSRIQWSTWFTLQREREDRVIWLQIPFEWNYMPSIQRMNRDLCSLQSFMFLAQKSCMKANRRKSHHRVMTWSLGLLKKSDPLACSSCLSVSSHVTHSLW
jgi:hypothetical protein